MFRLNNNLPSHYPLGLRNREKHSYGNQGIVPHEPHRLSTTMAHPEFQNQVVSSSNHLGNARQFGFNEPLLAINDMKMSNDTRVTQLEK